MVYSSYPQRLKPEPVVTPDGAAEAVPYPFSVPSKQLGKCARTATQKKLTATYWKITVIIGTLRVAKSNAGSHDAAPRLLFLLGDLKTARP
jgi:hypothetical protein